MEFIFNKLQLHYNLNPLPAAYYLPTLYKVNLKKALSLPHVRLNSPIKTTFSNTMIHVSSLDSGKARAAARFSSLLRAHVRFSSAQPNPNLEESIRAAVEAKAYTEIPHLLNASNDACRNPNPFMFLSALSESHIFRVIDDMLQSFISICPRSRPRKAYSCLLSLTLETSPHLPLALAVVQRTLRSGCLPPPQIHLLLAEAWLDRRLRQSQPVLHILSEMNSIRYSPDCGTCNYLILSLCKIDQFAEAAKVLSGMSRGGCNPDSDSFGTLIAEVSDARMVNEVVELLKEMVCVHFLNPRKETIVKAMLAMQANVEVRRAVEMVEFLEGHGVDVGFEAYESGLDGLLEARQFVLAGKLVMRMTEKGFIPYIRVRQRLYEGLVGVGEAELASVVRQRFAQLKS